MFQQHTNGWPSLTRGFCDVQKDERTGLYWPSFLFVKTGGTRPNPKEKDGEEDDEDREVQKDESNNERWPSFDLTPLQKGESEDEGAFEKFIPFLIDKAAKDSDEHILCGIVYEPDEVDSQGDFASVETIREAAEHFMENIQTFKVNHKGKAAKIKVLQSYVAPQDLAIAGQSIKKGSWILSVRVLDSEIWKAIKDGTLTGFSMAGLARTA